MSYCGIDDDGASRYCQIGYYCCDMATHWCCLSTTVTVHWYSQWWFWVAVVFFVVILAIALCSYYRRYVAQRAGMVGGPQPVQCGVTSVTTSSMPMHPTHGQPGAPPTAYPGASPHPGASPYPGASSTPAGQTSPQYPTQTGLPQKNIPGHARLFHKVNPGSL